MKKNTFILLPTLIALSVPALATDDEAKRAKQACEPLKLKEISCRVKKNTNFKSVNIGVWQSQESKEVDSIVNSINQKISEYNKHLPEAKRSFQACESHLKGIQKSSANAKESAARRPEEEAEIKNMASIQSGDNITVGKALYEKGQSLAKYRRNLIDPKLDDAQKKLKESDQFIKGANDSLKSLQSKAATIKGLFEGNKSRVSQGSVTLLGQCNVETVNEDLAKTKKALDSIKKDHEIVEKEVSAEKKASADQNYVFDKTSKSGSDLLANMSGKTNTSGLSDEKQLQYRNDVGALQNNEGNKWDRLSRVKESARSSTLNEDLAKATGINSANTAEGRAAGKRIQQSYADSAVRQGLMTQKNGKYYYTDSSGATRQFRIDGKVGEQTLSVIQATEVMRRGYNTNISIAAPRHLASN